MSDIERSCWYALYICIVKNVEGDEALTKMGILKEGKTDRYKEVL